MALYMVRRTLPGARTDEMASAAQRIRDEADRLTRAGRPVRYLRSTYVSADGACACLFEADEHDDVRAVNERAAVPYDRIDTATTLSAEGLPRPTA
jgi:Protein of unknown function (DUF4242)